jgi:hypothetical protein
MENKIVTNDLPETLPAIPARLNLFSFGHGFGIIPFSDTQEGKVALEEYKVSIEKEKKVRQYLWGGLALIVLILFLFFYHFLAIFIGFFGGILCFTLCAKPIGVNASAILNRAINTHCQWVVKKLVDSCFHSVHYFYYRTDALIYNNNMCAYLSTKSGELVIYNKSNIKEVSRERVHLRSETTGSATTTGRSTNTVSTAFGVNPFNTRKHKNTTQVNTTTKEFYEWHLDILADFFEHPKISLVLPDGKFAEDEIGKAYAVLKP